MVDRRPTRPADGDPLAGRLAPRALPLTPGRLPITAANSSIDDLLDRDDSLPVSSLQDDVAARNIDGQGYSVSAADGQLFDPPMFDAPRYEPPHFDERSDALPDISQRSFDRLWSSIPHSDMPSAPNDRAVRDHGVPQGTDDMWGSTHTANPAAGAATAITDRFNTSAARYTPATLDPSAAAAHLDVDGHDDEDDDAPTGLTIALVIAAIGLAISAGWTIMTTEALTTGVLSVLPVEGFFAPLLASLAFGLVLSRTPINQRLAAFSLFGLFAAVELMPALGILRGGSPLSWLQVSLIDQRSGGAIPMFSAVSGGFPGASALYRTLTGSLGISSSAALNVLVPVLAHAAMLVPTWWITRRLSDRGRWMAMWFVVMFGGAAQDRLGSAPLACFLFAGLAAALWEEQHEGIAFERSELFWTVGMVALALVSLPGQSVLLAVLIVTAISRPGEARAKKLAAIAGVIAALGWVGWFMLGHGTANTPLMSTLRLVDAARQESALGVMPRTWVQAIPPVAGVLVAVIAVALAIRGLLKASVNDLIIVVGAAVAGALVVPGNWALRLVAISAPFLGVLAATPADDNPNNADRHERSALVYALAGSVIVLLALFARFGDVAFTSIQVADVDSVEFIAKSTPNNSQVLTNSAAVPWNPQRMGDRKLIRAGSTDAVVDVSTINRAASKADHGRPILLFLSVSGAKRADALRGTSDSDPSGTAIPAATSTSADENKILAEELQVSGEWTQLRSELGSVVMQYLPTSGKPG